MLCSLWVSTQLSQPPSDMLRRSCAVRFHQALMEVASTADRPLCCLGFGATLQCWEPQLDRLLQPDQPRPTRCLLLDNRGVGRSGSPARKSAYHTATMAEDILLLMVIIPQTQHLCIFRAVHGNLLWQLI